MTSATKAGSTRAQADVPQRRRDGASTQLTCVRCGTPICPKCLVRTDVPSAPVRSRARVAIGVAAVLAVAVLVGGLVLGRGGGSSSPSANAVGGATQQVSRADLGFSVDLPPGWTIDVDQTPGSIFFAHAVPPRTSARIFRGQTNRSLTGRPPAMPLRRLSYSGVSAVVGSLK